MFKKGKLFSSFVIMGITPLILMSVCSYINATQIINKKVNNSIKDNVKIMSRLVDSRINSFTKVVDYLSNDEDIKSILLKNNYSDYHERDIDINKIYKITNLVLVTQKLDIPIYISGADHYSYYTNMDYFSSLYQNLNSDIFKNADKAALLKKPYVYIHRRVDGKYSKDIVMGIVEQVKDLKSDRTLGYISLDVYDEYFDNIFHDVNAYDDDNIYVLDGSGTIVTDKLYKNLTGFSFNKKYLNQILDNGNGTFQCNLNSKNYIAYFDTAQGGAIKIVETIPETTIYSDRTNVIIFSLVSLLLFIIGSVWMSYLLTNFISKPVNKLTELMGKVVKGDRTVAFNVQYDDEIGHLGTSFNNMVREIHRLIDEVYMENYLCKDAEFEALKAQVNPHFLYNILESVNWMAKMGKCSDVSRMITMLGSFLRYNISQKGDIVTVAEDMEQVENYISLQEMRFGDKLRSDIHIDPEIKQKKILKLLIQPIVENAIIHGIEPKRGKGHLIINGDRVGDNIVFEIMDDGVGISQDTLHGEGLGIQNVDKRIKIHYGENYGLHMGSKKDFTCFKIELPYAMTDKGVVLNDKGYHC